MNDKYNEKELISFWNKYYKDRDETLPRSDFAEFTMRYLKKEKSLIDIGCGDGRDSVFFSKQNIFTTGVDFSTLAIKKNKELKNAYLKFELLNLNEIQSYRRNFNYAYCRFLFHAINEDIEDNLFVWFKQNIKDMVFIETRVEEELTLNTEQDHFRRHFKEEDFLKKILNLGYKILYSETSNNFSKYKKIYNVSDLKHDPLLLRAIISL